MLTKMEQLKKELEDKLILNKPYNEIYNVSIALDEEINRYYNTRLAIIGKKQQT